MQSPNPLVPQSDDASEESGVLYVHRKAKPVALAATAPTPTPSTPIIGAATTPAPEPPAEKPGENAALALIRDKLERIYSEEPDAVQEQQKATAAKPPSKHQAFIQQLHVSGRSLAEVQTAWHHYYANLPDHEKHQVWQEFYETNEQAQTKQHLTAAEVQPYQPLRLPSPSLSHAFARPQPATPALRNPLPKLKQLYAKAQALRPTSAPVTTQLPATDKQTFAEVRTHILSAVTANGRLGLRHHLRSLSFGLTIGFITLVITLFGLFNEVVIAPFIQPGRTAGATPIIVDPSSIAATTEPEIIIPKINLEIPVDYTQVSNDENTIQNALQNGIVHYPSTVMPGQSGNAAFFGHSSNNLFSPGKYKFAFVLLHELKPGDTFYLTRDGKAYIYKVFTTKIVNPNQVEVLNDIPGHPATATLITCDPPGTALRRLAVVADQISPDPATNGAGANSAATANTGTTLPDNGPSLLQRIWNAIF